MTIQYREGDLFEFVPSMLAEHEVAFICHVANDCGCMGAGFVLPLARHFPLARDEYMKWHRGEETTTAMALELGVTQFVNVADNVIVCNMVGQHNVGGKRPLRYNAIAMCMDQVARVIEAGRQQYKPEDYKAVIHAPFFGAGLAGGDWRFIEQLIDDCWLKQNIPVTIHYIPGKTPPEWRLP